VAIQIGQYYLPNRIFRFRPGAFKATQKLSQVVARGQQSFGTLMERAKDNFVIDDFTAAND